jgi:hypothetical protein
MLHCGQKALGQWQFWAAIVDAGRVDCFEATL